MSRTKEIIFEFICPTLPEGAVRWRGFIDEIGFEGDLYLDSKRVWDEVTPSLVGNVFGTILRPVYIRTFGKKKGK